MSRPCYKVGPGKPAAELYGEWAASLAAGYLVFKDKGGTGTGRGRLGLEARMRDVGKLVEHVFGSKQGQGRQGNFLNTSLSRNKDEGGM